MVFTMMCFKVFSKFPIGFNGFQNDVFQSVFKIPHKFSMVFTMMCFNIHVFKIPHRLQQFFNDHVSKCFQNSS